MYLLVRRTDECDGMTLQVKKFGIPQDMIDNIERGETPLSTDLKKALESEDDNNA